MRRYFRLYANFLRFSFTKALQFRLDFFFRIVMDSAYYGIHLAFYAVIYKHTALLGGWDLDQALIFAAGFFVVDALHMTLFANNMWMLPYYINRGDLDYYLVRPVSPMFILSLREFAANSFVNLLIALGVLFWALHRYPGNLAPVDLAMFSLLLLMGTFIYFLLHLSFLIPVFWTHSGRGFGDLYFRMQSFMERPDKIFKGWLRILLVSVLPFSMMASLPSHALLEQWDWRLPLHMAAVTFLLWLAVMAFWRTALRAYSSASS
jgi:ABC-2 type transport system permease protein